MSGTKKDMRRADLIVPYAEPAKSKSDDEAGRTVASTMPMVAIFTRNKIVAWVSVVFSIQSWLAESSEQRQTASTPGYFSVGMSLMAVVVSYLPLFLPPTPGTVGKGSGTEAPSAAPPS